MKACIQTNCLPDRGIQQAMITIESMGCFRVEISSDSTRNHMYELSQLPWETPILNNSHVVCLAGGWVDFARGDLDRLDDQIMMARRIHASHLRVWISNPREKILVSPELLNTAAENASRVGKAFPDVDFLFENHGGLLADHMLAALFFESVDLPNVGLLMDPVNFIDSGEDPVQAIHELKKWARHVHVKDRDSSGYRVLGEGTVPWKEIFRALKDVKYEGFCSLEHAVEPDYEETTKAGWSRLLEFLRL